MGTHNSLDRLLLLNAWHAKAAKHGRVKAIGQAEDAQHGEDKDFNMYIMIVVICFNMKIKIGYMKL